MTGRRRYHPPRSPRLAGSRGGREKAVPPIKVEKRDLRAHTAKRMRTTSPSATT